MFLEIFKTGTHTDSQGITGQYSAESLDKIVQNYKNRLRETPNSEAPVVLGHPETSDSAKGCGYFGKSIPPISVKVYHPFR